MPKTVCAKKDIEGLQTCELKVGHRGEHQAEWQGEIITWGRDRKTTRVRQSSDRQDARTAFLAGVKAQRLVSQLALYGRYVCEHYGCSVSFSGYQFSEAWQSLDLHHTRARATGLGYREGRDFGVDAPSGLDLLCREHHEQEHGQIQWSSAS